jgi:hypothetical protein
LVEPTGDEIFLLSQMIGEEHGGTILLSEIYDFASEAGDISDERATELIIEYLIFVNGVPGDQIRFKNDIPAVEEEDIADIANIADNLPANLTAGMTIPEENKEFVRQAPEAMKEAAIETGMAALMFIPGPEVLIFKAFAKLKGGWQGLRT